jgi:hypothetical protein
MFGSRTGGWSLPCVMVSSLFGSRNVVWTDSWLSIAGAGCGLTRVGAGEEQARKVVAGEASRCGEGFVRVTRWPVGSSAGRMVA